MSHTKLLPILLFAALLPCTTPCFAQNAAKTSSTQESIQKKLGDTVEARYDLPYTSQNNPKQMVDVFLPKKRASDKPLPVVVFIHGGGWVHGDRQSYDFRAATLAASGNYVTVSVGYRWSGEAIWPAQIHDCKAAIRWIRGHAKELNIDPDKIGATGSSAGGHLVAMLGVSGGVKELEGNLGEFTNLSSSVTCVVNYCGPSDLSVPLKQGEDAKVDDDAVTGLIGGSIAEKKDAVRSASPLTYVSASAAPIMNVHGTSDMRVNFTNSEKLHAALKKAGASSLLIPVTNSGHAIPTGPELADRIQKFWDMHLRGIKAEISTEPIVVPPQRVVPKKQTSATELGAPFHIQLDTVTKGYDGKYCWAQARAAAIPRAGQPPIMVITMNPLLVAGSDVYFALNEMRSDDFGKTWKGPLAHKETLGRRPAGMEGDKPVEIVPADFWPKWHAKTGKVLGTGATVRYVNDKGPLANTRRETSYSVYNPDKQTWTPWATLEVPEGELSFASSAGCVQRLDLPNGDILLPVYYKERDNKFMGVEVLRCGFDGKKLTLLEQGNRLALEVKRGLAQPSLTRYRGKFFLTIRNDEAGYVATSDDGLHFGELHKWLWDDGTALGTYNTQAHWVNHSNALFLVYTRRGANNDHIFRHRAPLFIAEVNPDTLRVIRATERVLIPEIGARFGNFGVCEVNENETWVVETEWMQRPPEEPVIPVDNKWGAEGRVYAARIIWDKPNLDWDKR